jgi:hypothetical protein
MHLTDNSPSLVLSNEGLTFTHAGDSPSYCYAMARSSDTFNSDDEVYFEVNAQTLLDGGGLGAIVGFCDTAMVMEDTEDLGPSSDHHWAAHLNSGQPGVPFLKHANVVGVLLRHRKVYLRVHAGWIGDPVRGEGWLWELPANTELHALAAVYSDGDNQNSSQATGIMNFGDSGFAFTVPPDTGILVSKPVEDVSVVVDGGIVTVTLA